MSVYSVQCCLLMNDDLFKVVICHLISHDHAFQYSLFNINNAAN